MTNRVMRLETGSGWSHAFLIKGGDPPVPLTISDWTLEGKASIKQLESTTVDLVLGNGLDVVDHVITEPDLEFDETLEVGQEVQLLKVSLTAEETDELGVNIILFEVRRTNPQPTRPVLRFSIHNNRGY
jgi:hypothetical protein